MNLQNPDTAPNDLQDLVSMSDSLNDTNNNGETAHGDGDSVHKEGMVSSLDISDSPRQGVRRDVLSTQGRE